MSFFSKKVLIIFFLIFITVVSDYFFISKNLEHSEIEKKLLLQNLVKQSEILFDLMVVTREWNAQHKSVYVQNTDLKPNEYLAQNVVYTEDGLRLVRINPAWMTRQLSELASQNSGYLYKITSLDPLNPDNEPDKFGREALEFFEKNENSKYYYTLPSLDAHSKHFDFMGALKVESSCVSCHVDQVDDIGKIRGGIRVSIPIDTYKKRYENLQEYERDNVFVIIIFSSIALFGLIVAVMVFLKNQENIKNLNKLLKRKVQKRTKQLDSLNKSLESRVEKAVKDAQEKDKVMIAQSRNAAMGEMVSMIAHQWRQPLSEITMINNNIMAEVLFDKDVNVIKKHIEHSFEIVDHLSDTIDDFSSFFKPTKMKEIFLLNEMFLSLEKMFKNILEKNNIELVCISQEKIELNTYKRELLHVFINLINNAKDAFTEKEIDKRVITINVHKENDRVFIEICDTAGGVIEENYDKIFEPYFSTKSKNGTGLGLYISKVIIENHMDGSLKVRNKKYGACFMIELEQKG